MNVLICGATGQIGGGALAQCLVTPEVTRVTTLGRKATGRTHPKLREIVREDLYDFGPIAGELREVDTVLFCLGVTSAGMTEEAYRRVTVDIALALAKVLMPRASDVSFIFVSGAGTDSSGKSSVMWARVKGEAENALTAMPFKHVHAFRPAFVRPVPGTPSRTLGYRIFYALLRPLFPLLKLLFPRYVTEAETMALAMLEAAARGAKTKIVESRGIAPLADAWRRNHDTERFNQWNRTHG